MGGITSEISCPISDRTVTVSGISSYEPSFDDPIVLKLSGYSLSIFIWITFNG